MNLKKTSIFLITFVVLFACFGIGKLYAEEFSSTIAVDIEVDGDLLDGAIVCSYEEGNKLCENAYDKNILGVIVTNPALHLRELEPGGTKKPVINSGNAYVLVSSKNGTINFGDFITSSDFNGVGQKADINGYILGTALESWDIENENERGRILVAVNIRATGVGTGEGAGEAEGEGEGLVNLLRKSSREALQSPFAFLRYLLAAIIAIVSIIMGIRYFGKMSSKGVESIGRNPLAGNKIQSSVLINGGITLGIMGLGIFVAYLILIL